MHTICSGMVEQEIRRSGFLLRQAAGFLRLTTLEAAYLGDAIAALLVQAQELDLHVWAERKPWRPVPPLDDHEWVGLGRGRWGADLVIASTTREIVPEASEVTVALDRRTKDSIRVGGISVKSPLEPDALDPWRFACYGGTVRQAFEWTLRRGTRTFVIRADSSALEWTGRLLELIPVGARLPSLVRVTPARHPGLPRFHRLRGQRLALEPAIAHHAAHEGLPNSREAFRTANEQLDEVVPSPTGAPDPDPRLPS